MQRRDALGLTQATTFPLFLVPSDTADDAEVAPLPAVVLLGGFELPAPWRGPLAHAFRHLLHAETMSGVVASLQTDLTAVALVPLSPLASDPEIEVLRAAPVAVRQRIVSIVETFSPRTLRLAADVGVTDYIAISSSPDDVMWRLRLRLLAFLARDILAASSAADQWATAVEASATLSPKEYRLYAHLVRHFGQPVTRSDALRTIWEREPNDAGPSNIVDVYIRYLRIKLRALAPHLEIATVRHVGYVLRQCPARLEILPADK